MGHVHRLGRPGTEAERRNRTPTMGRTQINEDPKKPPTRTGAHGEARKNNKKRRVCRGGGVSKREGTTSPMPQGSGLSCFRLWVSASVCGMCVVAAQWRTSVVLSVEGQRPANGPRITPRNRFPNLIEQSWHKRTGRARTAHKRTTPRGKCQRGTVAPNGRGHRRRQRRGGMGRGENGTTADTRGRWRRGWLHAETAPAVTGAEFV